jgi:hypothetical protein
MKVNLDKEGTITIEAEGDLEDYALTKWVDDFEHDRCRLHVAVTDNNRPSTLRIIGVRRKIIKI